MDSGGQAIASSGEPMFPVFRGLADAKFSGKKIARIVGVAPPTYSKWRTGRSKIPPETMVFLTLLLADRIDEIQAESEREGGKTLRFETTLKSIYRHLQHQETINSTLPPRVVCEGVRLFRQWWQNISGDRNRTESKSGRFSAVSLAVQNSPYREGKRPFATVIERLGAVV